MKIHFIKKVHFLPDQAGELSVIGCNKVDIKLLHHRQPEEVFVSFTHEHHVTPCNPNQFDELEWEVHYKHGHYVLVIKWEVSESRDIVWGVKF